MITSKLPRLWLLKSYKISVLPSPSLFNEHIEDYVQTHPHETMIFLTFDIDRFGPINDEYGFDVGDKIIYQYYDHLNNAFAPLLNNNHGVMSRLGSDELALFLYNEQQKDIEAITNNVLEVIRSFDYCIHGYNKQLTITCGMYITNAVDNVAKLRHMSIKAMMEGKRLGGNTLVVLTD